MITLYLVTATILYPADSNGYRTTRQVPTFYLNAAIQGITSAAHAERIAVNMLTEVANDDRVLVHAVAVMQQCEPV